MCFCSAGVCDADQGTEPSAGTLAGEGGRDCRAQGGTQQYSGKSEAPVFISEALRASISGVEPHPETVVSLYMCLLRPLPTVLDVPP
jgi:hypothetical protein